MKVHANLPCLRRKTKTPEKEPNCCRQANRNKDREQSRAKQKVPVFMFPIRNLTILLLFCFPWAAHYPPPIPLYLR